jgi:surface antigen
MAALAKTIEFVASLPNNQGGASKVEDSCICSPPDEALCYNEERVFVCRKRSLAMKRILAMLIVVILALPGCATSGRKEGAGTLIGAGTGALLGAQVGSGRGKLVAVAVGALAGAMMGQEIGRSLDRADQLAMERNAQQALEHNKSYQASSWTNPDTGNSGNITPVRTFQTAQGQYCREYQQTVIVGGQEQQAYGSACRQPDGSWRIVK